MITALTTRDLLRNALARTVIPYHAYVKRYNDQVAGIGPIIVRPVQLQKPTEESAGVLTLDPETVTSEQIAAITGEVVALRCNICHRVVDACIAFEYDGSDQWGDYVEYEGETNVCRDCLHSALALLPTEYPANLSIKDHD